MKASSAQRLLPFETFGEAAAFDLEVEVSCQCGRRVVIDGMAPAFRDRRIMGARFRCTTILPHGVACGGYFNRCPPFSVRLNECKPPEILSQSLSTGVGDAGCGAGAPGHDGRAIEDDADQRQQDTDDEVE